MKINGICVNKLPNATNETASVQCKCINLCHKHHTKDNFVMGCKSHHAMLDPYCGGTTCTRAAGSGLLRAKLTRGQRERVGFVVLVRCEVEDLLLGLLIVVPRCGEEKSS